MSKLIRSSCRILLGAAMTLSACDKPSPTAATDDAGTILDAGDPAPLPNGPPVPSHPAPPPPPPPPPPPVVVPVILPATLHIDSTISLPVPAGGSWTKVVGTTGTPLNPTVETTSHVGGSLKIVTPPYTFTLGQASLTIVSDANGVTKSVSGTAKVTMPALHTFSGLGLDSPLSASFGYDLGSNLTALGMPLAATRKYLYFSFHEGFEGSFGTASFSAGPGGTRTVILDPLDPAIFIAGPMGLVTAVALSEKSLIPYTANTTWGFDTPETEFPSFGGQSFIAGEIPLEEIPITISGDVTTTYVNWDGISALDKGLFEHKLGVNGSLNLGWDFLDGAFRLEVPVAHASMYLESSTHPYRISAAISGTAGTDDFLPSWMPVLLSKNSKIAGYMDTYDVSRNHVDGESDMTIVASTLSSVIGVKLNDIPLSKSSYHVDRVGFRYNGYSSTGMTPQLAADEIKVTACFGGDAFACLSDDQSANPPAGSKDWIIRMEGDVKLVGVPLLSATTMASPAGLTVSAQFKTQVQDVEMLGSITPGHSLTSPHVSVTGTASFHMPLIADNEVLAAVVDGATCGYELITSAAKCGQSLTHFTDVFHCGKPHCHWSWRHGLRCSDLSCSVNIPKTCADPQKPKSCKPPKASDFNLGSVSGSVALSITESGIGGKITGTFCAVGGGCSSISDVGTLDFSSITNPKICIPTHEISPTLPTGKFCVPF